MASTKGDITMKKISKQISSQSHATEKRDINRDFYRVHGMQTQSSDENSVCLSVYPSIRPSICQTQQELEVI